MRNIFRDRVGGAWVAVRGMRLEEERENSLLASYHEITWHRGYARRRHPTLSPTSSANPPCAQGLRRQWHHCGDIGGLFSERIGHPQKK